MYDVLSFTYMHPELISRASQLLLLGPEALNQLSDRYTLFSSNTNPSHNDCPIHEIPYQDFVDYRFPWPLNRLEELEAIYSKDEFEQIFPRDMSNIKRKLKNTINFVFDKVYKSEELIVVYDECIKSSPPTQLVPQAIRDVLQNNFTIVSEGATGITIHTLIRKRSEINGNDASGDLH